MIRTPLSTVVGGAFWTPEATIVGGTRPSFETVMKKLFANSEQGFWYDPNDLSTMFQDAAGTVPVTAVGQPVGLLLDKNKELELGVEKVVNGDFSNGLTGWAAGTNASMTLSSGELILTTPGSQAVTVNNAVYQTVIGHYAGRRYNIEFDATYISGGDLSVGVGNQPAIIVSSAQNAGQKKRYTCSLSDTGVSPTRVITFASKDVLSTWRIDNVSCKQVLGNHAYQTTSAARPILRDTPRRIDFDAVDDKLITNLPAQLTGCTVIRSVPNVGTQILTNQTIPATYEDNTDHCGLIVINRALTPSETSVITAEFNKMAGV